MMLLLLALMTLPDPTLTPGKVVILNKEAVCQTRWGKDRRHVTVAMRKEVFRRYGIPWSDHVRYEVDHKIPRELGGADDLLNLWPQLWPEAHIKDHEENRLHKAVCAGTVTLADAQNQMRHWHP